LPGAESAGQKLSSRPQLCESAEWLIAFRCLGDIGGGDWANDGEERLVDCRVEFSLLSIDPGNEPHTPCPENARGAGGDVMTSEGM
jgi:hypothetical protein